MTTKLCCSSGSSYTSKNHDFGFDSFSVAASTHCFCFLLASVPLRAAASEIGARLRLPKAGALRRVRRFESMPDRFDLVGERLAAAGAEEMTIGLTGGLTVGLTAVLITRVSGRDVEAEGLEIRV